ncbi:ferric reductase NAD binding domain-domain-containing protein [Kockovaella imperatae]|uniref:Ferric reductase NAD binding domain-domain-containing protein n=1 Tax=Kockovaella imperatae TaxID=4999 RepID=A0A1Y1U8N1_9TREE|nr:ferric reductase NAD binding domain-domain-containing protein [Kockovaella imperatae]ORX34383.1 ferric reductase NAD binding domain-domain-containing protein [Kockovaella imperatae]
MTIAGRVSVWIVNEGAKHFFMATWTILNLVGFAFALVNYSLKDNFVGARAIFGSTYVIARGAAQILHIDVAFILLPVCRNFISLLRRTPLNDIIPFDRSISFHKQVGWAIVVYSLVHIIAHMVNFAKLAIASKSGFTGFLMYNFATGPGVTGWVMTAILGIMVFFATEKNRRSHFERFWYSHHLFVLFFIGWQLHGMFCMIQPDRPPFCSAGQIGVFWKYFIPGGVVWIIERILREVRARHITYISKVIQHPSKVIEVQIKKDHTTRRAGQYIFINCPEISYFQYHPFTLTSAPEEDYISVHIRVVGDWTTAFAKALGADLGDSQQKKIEETGGARELVLSPSVGKVLPRIMIDGPFGSASEDFTKFETVLLVGAGIGVTPFASILKSIWYRLNKFGKDKKTRLSKVYFVWVIRDFGSAEWFHSLLQAVEAEDEGHKIEIHIYLTARIDENKMNNLLIQDVGADKDSITNLRAPTHFGRPNWDRVFESIANKHPDTDCGVFFCGPPMLSKTLHQMSNKYTSPMGCRFIFGKENF